MSESPARPPAPRGSSDGNAGDGAPGAERPGLPSPLRPRPELDELVVRAKGAVAALRPYARVPRLDQRFTLGVADLALLARGLAGVRASGLAPDLADPMYERAWRLVALVEDAIAVVRGELDADGEVPAARSRSRRARPAAPV